MRIRKIIKKGSKYKVLLDNDEVITTYDNVIIDYNLLYDKKIDKKLYEEILNKNIYYENYDKVLKMVSNKMRSENEIRKFLNVSLEDEEKIINNLKEIGLINDKEYALAYTNDRINLSLDGPYKIRKSLEENKIDEEYINEALENFNTDLIDSKINKVINKRLKNNKDSSYIFKQKTSLYLSNLGYSHEDIFRNLESIEIDNSNLEQEMLKIFNKLKKKYDGYTLYNKLKQKLYAKGFNTEEINDFIQKNSSF